MGVTRVALSSLPELAGASPQPSGLPERPCLVVDLDGPVAPNALAALETLATRQLVIGHLIGDLPQSAALAAPSFVVGPGHSELPLWVQRFVVADPSALTAADAAVTANPVAATVLAQVLHLTATADVPSGLVIESLAYSMLLTGPEFAAWRAGRARRPMPSDSDGEAVLISRAGDEVAVVLNRPARHNAFAAAVRDGVIAGLDLHLDPDVQSIVLRGNGPSFCSGGDLDEFGSATDRSAAHLLRVGQSAGMAVYRAGAKVRAELHGRCIGAGIEVPAFAPRVTAAPDTLFRLPEVAMGLIPGAGGTVSVTHRIGRWRTAWLALTGVDLDAPSALAWGLIDAISTPHEDAELPAR